MTIRAISRYIICASSLVIGLESVGSENDIRFSIEIQFNNHRFIPQKVEVQAGVPLTIRVVNSSKERIEFESFKLAFERVVHPGHMVVLQLPPLHPGTYDFYDDFHDDVPEGVIVAQ